MWVNSLDCPKLREELIAHLDEADKIADSFGEDEGKATLLLSRRLLRGEEIPHPWVVWWVISGWWNARKDFYLDPPESKNVKQVLSSGRAPWNSLTPWTFKELVEMLPTDCSMIRRFYESSLRKPQEWKTQKSHLDMSPEEFSTFFRKQSEEKVYCLFGEECQLV